jgi:Nif-specific regulatory protein
MNPRLVALTGPASETTFPLRDSEVGIGRGASNQICISDPVLSRQHCIIERTGGQYVVRDLGSRHGTLVNGMPISEQLLSDGDQIVLGNSILCFLLTDEQARPQVCRAELSDVEHLQGSQTLLRQQDAIYLNSETLTGDLLRRGRVARDLNTLLEIAKHISNIRTSESLAWQLLGMIFDVVPAERGAMISFTDDPEQINWTVAWDRVRGVGAPVRVSRTIVRRVVSEQSGLMITDVPGNEELRGSASLLDVPIHSLICAPIVVAGKIAGVIYLDTHNPKTRFDDDHLQMLTAIASLSGLALDNLSYLEALKQENRDLRTQMTLEHNMVGASPEIREVFEFIRRVATTDSTVLIEGESGTGKELVARAIHQNSPRADRPFVAINCAAIAESLLESELFGHERGAFTGAVAQKKGKIENANGGTLFLDEVGELALPLQAKLLRVLQEREFERVGGARPMKIDIRVIAATNRDLQDAVRTGTFRKDLFYRLDVVSITVPPLRERREDIPLLAEHFIANISRKCNLRSKVLSPETKLCLTNYDWPGNVRELQNAIERALVLGSTNAILLEDLPEAICESSPAGAVTAKYTGAMKDTKKQLILQAMREANGSYIEAAKSLGIHPNSLLRLIRRLDLKIEAKRGNS